MRRLAVPGLLAALAAALAAAPAGAQTTLTFTDVACAGAGETSLLQYEAMGFRLTSNPTGFRASCPGDAYYPGSAALRIAASGATASLGSTSGAAFSATSIDLGSLFAFASSEITFTGILVGGGTVTQTFRLAGNTGDNALATFTFSPAFANLRQLDFGAQVTPFYQFDNVVLNASTVPEPSTGVLLGSGLLVVAGAMARRKGGVAG